MKSSNCTCNGSSAMLERPRFYARQLVTPDVLSLGQDYGRNLQRLHNRMLHGWGVVCGLAVCAVPASSGGGSDAWKVSVQPGYALAPSGDGIFVGCASIVDLRDASNCADPCAGTQSEDPWCSDVYVQRDPGTYYIAIRYKEAMVRPERVQPAGCGCGDQRCENSRLRDSFEIGVLCDCPLPDEDAPPVDFASLFKCGKSECPECAASQWVGLARVEVDQEGAISLIDNCDCRRLVASFANFWWKCDCPAIKLETTGSVVVLDRDKPTDVKIKAEGLDPKATVAVPRGVKVTSMKTAAGVLTLTLTVDKNAEPGPRSIVVTNPGANVATLKGAIEVPPMPGGPAVRGKRVITPRP